MEGSNIVWMFDQKFWVKGTYDAGPGKMCQCTAKMSTRTGAITNGGRASMANVPLFDARSNSLLGRRAECIAMGRAMTNTMIWEKMMSSRSMGKDWVMMLVVDWCVV